MPVVRNFPHARFSIFVLRICFGFRHSNFGFRGGLPSRLPTPDPRLPTPDPLLPALAACTSRKQRPMNPAPSIGLSRPIRPPQPTRNRNRPANGSAAPFRQWRHRGHILLTASEFRRSREAAKAASIVEVVRTPSSVRNPNLEARNSKQIRSTKLQLGQTALLLGLFRISIFGFRVFDALLLGL